MTHPGSFRLRARPPYVPRMRNRRHTRPRRPGLLILGFLVAGQACVRVAPPVPGDRPSAISPAVLEAHRGDGADPYVRIGVLNTKLLPFSGAGSRAEVIAARILGSDLDIVALSEVFSETGRSRLVELLGESFPHRVEYIGSRKLHRFDSGLMVFSRLPLLPIPRAVPHETRRVRGRTAAGSDPDSVAGFVRFTEFGDCARSDCWAAKGVGYVRVATAEAHEEASRLHLFFTHMQASYGSDDARRQLETAGVRSGQRSEMAEFIDAVAGSDLERGEQALLVGDLNVDGSADITGGVPALTAAVADERQRMLDELAPAFPAGVSDTWRDHGPSEDPGLTFPVRKPSVRFDYVLVSPPADDGGPCVMSIRRAWGLDVRRAPGTIDVSVERRVTDHVGLVVDLLPRSGPCGPLADATGDGSLGAR